METWFVANWSILLLIPGIIFGVWAQSRVSSAYKKYSRVMSAKGVTANRTVDAILHENSIFDVTVVADSGTMTDHYNPRKGEIQLSRGVYGNSSIAAIAIAAHECGHVLQHRTGYFFLRFRTALVPVVNFANMLTMPLILLGIFMSYTTLIDIAVIIFSVTVLFQAVTLPVEFNASRRALLCVQNYGLVTPEEIPMAKSVLNAAAMTYVAATLSSLLSLLRLLLIARSRR